MEMIKVLHNQSLLDIAIQHTGSVENAFLIAKENSLAVDSYLVPSYELIIPNGVAFNRDILNYYNAKSVKPATRTIRNLNDLIKENKRGIGYMKISDGLIEEENGFIISNDYNEQITF